MHQAASKSGLSPFWGHFCLPLLTVKGISTSPRVEPQWLRVYFISALDRFWKIRFSWRGGFESPVQGHTHVLYRSTTGLLQVHIPTYCMYINWIQLVISDKMFVTMCEWIVLGSCAGQLLSQIPPVRKSNFLIATRSP
jgi:hypothetical protein